MRYIPFLAIAALLALGLVTAPKAVAIRVQPQVVMVNGSIQIMCVVEPDDQNRQITSGLRFYSASSRSMDGAQAPKTWVFPRLVTLPCPQTDDSYTAYCQVLRNDDSVVTDIAVVQVAGCE